MSVVHPAPVGHSTKKWLRGGKKKKSPEDEQEEADEYGKVEGEQLERMLEEMFDEMNLNEGMRGPLRQRDLEEKRNMLRNFHRPKAGAQTPKEFVESMNVVDRPPAMLELVLALRVSLTNSPVSWLREFGEGGGLDQLLTLLKECQFVSSATHVKLEHECVRCLKAFMNNKHGLSRVLQDRDGLSALARSLQPAKPQIMTEVLRIMAAMSLVPPNGHDKALEALTLIGEFRDMGRFQVLIDALNLDSSGTKNHLLQIACIQFINAIVTTPEDLDFRIHLRNEVIRAGLDDVLARLPEDATEDLSVQLEVFEYHREEDITDLQMRFGDIRLELEDPYELFNRMLNLVQDTVAYPHFLSIMQHMVMLPNEDITRSQYMLLFEEFISQVTLYHGGIHPDFALRKFDIDIDGFLEAAVPKATADEAVKRADTLFTQMEEHDTAAREKEKKLEAQLAELKAQLDIVGKAGAKPGASVAPPVAAATTAAPSGDATSSVTTPAAAAPPPPPPPPPPGPGGAAPPPPPPPPGPGGGPPPPPPPPGMGGPPPPPPPPGMGGPPGPPPPPGMGGPPPPGGMGNPAMSLGIVKKKYEPKNQTKRLNWTKLPARSIKPECFWAKCEEDSLGSEDLFSSLSSVFASKATKKSEEKSVEEKKPSKKVKVLRVLDAKTDQNLAIPLGSLKFSYEELRTMILRIDAAIPETTIVSMTKYLPTPDQLRELVLFRNSYDTLSDAEQFCCTMGSVSRLSQRLEAILTRNRFDEEVDDVLPDVEAMISACEEVQCESFGRVLQLVLLVGNYMNAGSRNQQSFGFELNFLTKLINTKSVDNTMNLMHFLAQIIGDKYPDLVNFQEDLSHVNRATKVSEDGMAKVLVGLQRSIAQIRNELKHHADCTDEDDKFFSIMGEFVKHAEGRLSIVEVRLEKMREMIKVTSEFFCVDLKKQPIEEMFSDVNVFMANYAACKLENEKRRELENKKKKQLELELEKNERKKKKTAAFSNNVPVVDMNAAGDQEGVLDGLMDALSSGTAFTKTRNSTNTMRKRESKRLRSRERDQRSMLATGGAPRVRGLSEESSDAQRLLQSLGD